MQHPRRHRPRHLLLLTLAAVEAATLASGVAAAAAPRLASAPSRVSATTQVAPVVVSRPAMPVARLAAPRHRTRHVAPARPRKAAPAVRPRVRRTAVTVRRSSSPAVLMAAAIARIPGYRPGLASWELTSRYGHWGIADLGTGAIYIEPSVPTDRMYDVVVHEWSHVLSMRDYGMDVNTAVAELNRVFGGSGLDGAERAADCMARLLGARWTHYTNCTNSTWRAAARRLVAGERL